MSHIISDEQLQQLLDPDMPQCAKEIVAQEIKMGEDAAVQLPPPTSSYLEVKATDDVNIPVAKWASNQNGYNIVADKPNQISSTLCPGVEGLTPGTRRGERRRNVRLLSTREVLRW